MEQPNRGPGARPVVSGTVTWGERWGRQRPDARPAVSGTVVWGEGGEGATEAGRTVGGVRDRRLQGGGEERIAAAAGNGERAPY
eukprot:112968-Chlamydomonas_euryale.AAC.4